MSSLPLFSSSKDRIELRRILFVSLSTSMTSLHDMQSRSVALTRSMISSRNLSETLPLRAPLKFCGHK